MMENESGFNLPGGAPADRVPLGASGSGRYDFFRTRLHGKLHFEKRVADAWRGDLLTVEALRKEFEVGYALEHPGVVRYLFCEPGALYQEYIDGETLRQMIDNGDRRLQDPTFLRDLARQLLDALRYVHRHGVLHLDIKPENVMVERIGDRVKLIDFGCARTGAFVTTEGYTAAYRAPEQGEAETNIYTDIYLVGRLMRELTAWEGSGFPAREGSGFPATTAAGSKREWRRFLRKCDAENPADRFATDDEALAALPRVRKKSGALKKLLPIAVAAALLLGGALYWYPDPPANLTVPPRSRAGGHGDPVEASEPPAANGDERASRPSASAPEGAQDRDASRESTRSPRFQSGVQGSQPATTTSIERQLETEIAKIYKTRFIEPADRWLAEGGDPSYHPTLRAALEKAHEEADAVADRLAERNPAQRAAIEKKARDLNNLYQSKIGGYLERGWKKWEQGEGKEEVERLRKTIGDYYPL